MRHRARQRTVTAPLLLSALLSVAQPAVAHEILQIPGPEGALEGEALLVNDPRAGVVIIPGSGPTDRDGNGAVGLRSDSYKLLAEGLAAAGISTLRIDKRGFFGSEAAISDPEAVTIAAYAQDARRWVEAFSDRLGKDCIWLAGHSEGGLVALVAAEGPADAPICGLVLLATPGRPIGTLMREQFRKNPLSAPYLAELDALVAGLERGTYRDEAEISPVLRPLFRHGLQRYMIDLFSYDPAAIARSVPLPALVLQDGSDIQVTPGDAERLLAALPDGELVLLPDLTHMLKHDVAGDPLATYRDPSLPLGPDVVPAIVDFIQAHPAQ